MAPRRTLADGIAELRAEAGRQFDPVVVEALVEVVTADTGGPAGPPAPDSGLYRALHPGGNGGGGLALGRSEDG